jgi:hypothetical protein
MKQARTSMERKPGAGSRIVASLQEALDWAESNDFALRVSQVEVPTVDVQELRRKLGLSQ